MPAYTDKAFEHPLAGPLFRRVESLGFRISVNNEPALAMGSVPASLEAHAVHARESPPRVFAVRVIVKDNLDEALYRLALQLAACVRVDQES